MTETADFFAHIFLSDRLVDKMMKKMIVIRCFQGYCLSYDQEAYDCRQMGVEPSYVRDAVDQALDRIDADVDHVDSEPAATAAGATGPRTGTSSSSSTGGSAHQWAWPLTALATLVLARH